MRKPHLVGGVRRSVVDHRLVNRVRGLVRENAGGQAGHQLGDLVLVAKHHDIVLHQDVLTPELHFVLLRAAHTTVSDRVT